MSSDADIEGLVEALRDDGPSDHDAARIQARLAGLGVIAGASLAKGTAAASMPVGKMAAGALASTRWASLSLLPKVGIVAAASATAMAASVSAVHLATRNAAPPATEQRALPQRATPVTEAPARVASQTITKENAVAPLSEPATRSVPRNTAGSGIALTHAARTVAVVAPPSDVTGTARYDAPAGDIAPPPTVTSLAAETALIDAAFASLRAGDTVAAASYVAEHARRFPNGLLSRERERARQRLSDVSLAPPAR